MKLYLYNPIKSYVRLTLIFRHRLTKRQSDMDKIKSWSEWTTYICRNEQDTITVGMDKVKLLSEVTWNNYVGMDKINHDRNKKKDSTKIGMDSIGHDRNNKKTDST
jgi:hypothetical protein